MKCICNVKIPEVRHVLLEMSRKEIYEGESSCLDLGKMGDTYNHILWRMYKNIYLMPVCYFYLILVSALRETD